MPRDPLPRPSAVLVERLVDIPASPGGSDLRREVPHDHPDKLLEVGSGFGFAEKGREVPRTTLAPSHPNDTRAVLERAQVLHGLRCKRLSLREILVRFLPELLHRMRSGPIDVFHGIEHI